MTSQIEVRSREGVLFCVPLDIFKITLQYTTVFDTKPYNEILKNKRVQLSKFRELYIKAKVPYPVVFMSKNDIESQIDDYIKKTFAGVDMNRQYSIASHGTVDISEISIMLRHIAALQSEVSKSIPDRNNLCGIFLKQKYKSMSVKDKARIAREKLDIDINKIKSIQGKKEAFLYLERQLNKHNIFISMYDHRLCAQTIQIEDFAGIFINHKKAPYIFIRASDDKGMIDPWGRKNLILMLMLGMLLHKNNKPVMLNTKHNSDINDEAYQFAEEILMPQEDFSECAHIKDLVDIKKVSELYKVSPSAVIMRCYRLKLISNKQKESLLRECNEEFEKIRSKKRGGRNRAIEKGIVLNVGSGATDIILNRSKQGLIDNTRVNNLLCPRKSEDFSIDGIREYLNV
jgi:hypothetical protein